MVLRSKNTYADNDSQRNEGKTDRCDMPIGARLNNNKKRFEVRVRYILLVLLPYNMNIFELPEEENITDRIDLDELYDRKREYDESKLVIYNKILSRVHTKIKTTSRQSIHERCCWYIIPEIMIGITRYNVEECTSFLLTKLSAITRRRFA